MPHIDPKEPTKGHQKDENIEVIGTEDTYIYKSEKYPEGKEFTTTKIQEFLNKYNKDNNKNIKFDDYISSSGFEKVEVKKDLTEKTDVIGAIGASTKEVVGVTSHGVEVFSTPDKVQENYDIEGETIKYNTILSKLKGGEEIIDVQKEISRDDLVLLSDKNAVLELMTSTPPQEISELLNVDENTINTVLNWDTYARNKYIEDGGNPAGEGMEYEKNYKQWLNNNFNDAKQEWNKDIVNLFNNKFIEQYSPILNQSIRDRSKELRNEDYEKLKEEPLPIFTSRDLYDVGISKVKDKATGFFIPQEKWVPANKAYYPSGWMKLPGFNASKAEEVMEALSTNFDQHDPTGFVGIKEEVPLMNISDYREMIEKKYGINPGTFKDDASIKEWYGEWLEDIGNLDLKFDKFKFLYNKDTGELNYGSDIYVDQRKNEAALEDTVIIIDSKEDFDNLIKSLQTTGNESDIEIPEENEDLVDYIAKSSFNVVALSEQILDMVSKEDQEILRKNIEAGELIEKPLTIEDPFGYKGNNLLIEQYNKEVAKYSLLSQAYLLNFDPLSLKNSAWVGGIKESLIEDYWGGSFESRDEKRGTFYETLTDTYPQIAKEFTQEEIENLYDKTFLYSVGYGTPAFIQIMAEFAMTRKVGGTAFKRIGELSEVMGRMLFGNSKIAKNAAFYVSAFVEELAVIKTVNQAKSGLYGGVPIADSFAVAGPVGKALNNFYKGFFQAGVDGTYSSAVNFINKIPTPLQKIGAGTIQIGTGATVMTVGEIPEGLIEVFEGHKSLGGFVTSTFSPRAFAEKAALLVSTKGIAPLKGLVDTFNDGVKEINRIKKNIKYKKALTESEDNLSDGKGFEARNSDERSNKIKKAARRKYKLLGYSPEFLKNLTKLGITHEELNSSKDIGELISKAISKGGKNTTEGRIALKNLQDFQSKKGTLETLKELKKISESERILLLNSEYDTFLRNAKDPSIKNFMDGVNNLIGLAKKGKMDLSPEVLINLRRIGSPELLRKILESNNVNQEVVDFFTQSNKTGGYPVMDLAVVTVEQAKSKKVDLFSKEGKKYLKNAINKYSKQTDITQLKEQLKANPNLTNIKTKIENLEEEIDAIEDGQLEIERQAGEAAKVRSREYVEQAKAQAEKVGGTAHTFETRDEVADYFKKLFDKGEISKEVLDRKIADLKDPKKLSKGLAIEFADGRKELIFNMEDIFKSKDITVGPHETTHPWINMIIRKLGIKGNQQELNKFVEGFKTTLTDYELDVVENRLKNHPDYKNMKASGNESLEWFNAYVEGVVGGEIEFAEGVNEATQAKLLEDLIERKSLGKDIQWQDPGNAIRNILNAYAKGFVKDPGKFSVVTEGLKPSKKLKATIDTETGHIEIDESTTESLKTNIEKWSNKIKTLDPIKDAVKIKDLKTKIQTTESNIEKAIRNEEDMQTILNPDIDYDEKQVALNRLVETNQGLINTLKNKFDRKKVDQSLSINEVDKIKEDWDSQVDFYFSQLIKSYLVGRIEREKTGEPIRDFYVYAKWLLAKFTDVRKGAKVGEDFTRSIDKMQDEGTIGKITSSDPYAEEDSAIQRFEEEDLSIKKREDKFDPLNKINTPEVSNITNKTILQSFMTDVKSSKFYTDMKNLVRMNLADPIKREISFEKKPSGKVSFSKEKYEENLNELYPEIVDFIEAEGDFIRLRNWDIFYESTGMRYGKTKTSQPTLWAEKIPSPKEFVDWALYRNEFSINPKTGEPYTSNEISNKVSQRSLQVSWFLGLIRTKSQLSDVVNEGGGMVIDGKYYNIFDNLLKKPTTSDLTVAINMVDPYTPANVEKIQESSELVEDTKPIETKEKAENVGKTLKDKFGITTIDARRFFNDYPANKDNDAWKEEVVELNDGTKVTNNDIIEMVSIAIGENVELTGGKITPEAVSGGLLRNANTLAEEGPINENIYEEVDGELGLKDFQDINRQMDYTRGSKIEREANKKEFQIYKEGEVNFDKAEAHAKRMNYFIERLLDPRGSGTTIGALSGSGTRTTSAGRILENEAGEAYLEFNPQKDLWTARYPHLHERISGTPSSKSAEYFREGIVDELVSIGMHEKAAEKLLSKDYTREEKDKIFEETFTEADATARQEILRGLLSLKFDYVWEGGPKTKKDILLRYSDMVRIAKGESNNRLGQRTLATVEGAMYADLLPKEIWKKLEHATASVDFNEKVLDAIMRGDKSALLDLATDFKGVYGQRGKRPTLKTGEGEGIGSYTFDALDTELGATVKAEGLDKLLVPIDESGTVLADKIMVRNPDGGTISLMEKSILDVNKAIYKIKKSKKYNEEEKVEISEALKQNSMEIATSQNPPETANLIIKQTEFNKKAHKINTKTQEKEIEQIKVKGAKTIIQNSATTIDQLYNGQIIDKAIDNPLKKVELNGPGGTYSYDPNSKTIKSPNNSGKFQGNRKVIFTIGGPGSGKTTLVKSFMREAGLTDKDLMYVNLDTFKEDFKKQLDLPEDETKGEDWEKGLSAKLMMLARAEKQRQQEELLNEGKGLIVDGTGASYDQTMKQVNELKAKGYDVVMLYSKSSLDAALQRNKNRPTRNIPDNAVVKTHEKVEANIEQYRNNIGENFIEVDVSEVKEGEIPVEKVNEVYNQINKNVISEIEIPEAEMQESTEEFKEKVDNIINETFKIKPDQEITEAEVKKAIAGKRSKIRLMNYRARHAEPLLLELVENEGDWNTLEKNLLIEADKAQIEYNRYRQNVYKGIRGLNKISDVKKFKLDEKFEGNFTREDAVRMYLWWRNGHDVPGTNIDLINKARDLVFSDIKLSQYANNIERIIDWGDSGYIKPYDWWASGNLKTDIRIATEVKRKQFFSQFETNWNTIFSRDNLLKIEMGMGPEFKEWWEATSDMGDRIITNRSRAIAEPVGQRIVNFFHGSTALALFGNRKSMFTQLLSTQNFYGVDGNNIYQAAKAYADVPGIFAEMRFIIKSDYLIGRGADYDLALKELTELESKYKGTKDKAINLSFLLSKLGDRAAIVVGGSSMLYNRTKMYEKEGMSYEDAHERAWEETMIHSENTQQSTWAGRLSYQQTKAIGKVTLNFLNTQIRYNNIALSEAMKMKRGIGNKTKSVKRIINYVGLQVAQFAMLSEGLQFLFADDEMDDEKKQRLIDEKESNAAWNGMRNIIDGTGIRGKATTTIIGMIDEGYKYMTEDQKRSADIAKKMIQFSPALSIKIKELEKFGYEMKEMKKIYEETGEIAIKPMLRASTELFSVATNFKGPEHALELKEQMEFIMDERFTFWQHVSAALGWSLYSTEQDYYKLRKQKELGEYGIEYDPELKSEIELSPTKSYKPKTKFKVKDKDKFTVEDKDKFVIQ